jgi:two-component system cell cycle sensor histidine kinase/response regulator CckA
MKSERTVLVVEDDESLRKVASSVLKRAGYRVLEASDSDEAAQLWRSEFSSIDVLFTDILMPNLSGPELARELREVRPDLRIVFSSGSERSVVKKSINLVEKKRFLPKPYTPGQLREAIAATFSAS